MENKENKAKNPFGKAIPYAKAKTDAYAVYGNDPRFPGWTWYVLKTYQTPAKAEGNRFARAYCLVVSPMTGSSGELGDVYLSDISGSLIKGTDIRHPVATLQNALGMSPLDSVLA